MGKILLLLRMKRKIIMPKTDVPFELETALANQGALFHAAKPWSANSIADGNLVTGQNPASAKGVAEKMIAILEA
jgi:putative intracellular protease/amidase